MYFNVYVIDCPAPAELGISGHGPAIIPPLVDHCCFDDPDIINIGDSIKFDQKTAKSVMGYLLFSI